MSRKGFRNVFRLLCWEGAFSLIYDTWLSPSYVSGIAGELGVSVGLLSLLTAVPWIGSAGQLLGIRAYKSAPSVKWHTIQLAAIARSLWMIPVAMAWYWGFRAHRLRAAFPADRWFMLTSAVACASALLATSSGAAWMSWVKELVPGRFHGRFFGARFRYTMSALILAHLIAYAWIGWRPAGFPLGYGILLIGALGCAAASTLLLARVPEPSSELGRERLEWAPSWAESLKAPLRDPRFRGVLIFGSLFNGAIQLGGPYFAYYFTRELRLPMSTVVIWSMLTNLGWALAAVLWGKNADRARGPDVAFWLAAHAIALSPLFYVVPYLGWIRFIGPFDCFTNGIAWGGFSLVFTTLLMRACPPGRCGQYFSLYAACSGLMGALGNLAGARLSIWLAAWGGFRALWWLTTAFRLGVIWGCAGLLDQAALPGGDAAVNPVSAPVAEPA